MQIVAVSKIQMYYYDREVLRYRLRLEEIEDQVNNLPSLRPPPPKWPSEQSPPPPDYISYL